MNNRSTEKQRAKLYAKSLLDLSLKKDDIKGVLLTRQDLRAIAIASLVNANETESIRKSSSMMMSKTDHDFDFASMVNNIYAGAYAPVLEILEVIAKNRDLYLLSSVLEFYDLIFEDEFKSTIVDVTTKIDLDEKTRSLIKDKMETDLNTDVILHEHLDADMVGGIKLSAKGRILDLSVDTKLNKIKNDLTSIHQEV